MMVIKNDDQHCHHLISKFDQFSFFAFVMVIPNNLTQSNIN